MPLAIIAGMPNDKARLFRPRIDELSTHQAWRLAWVPARRNQADLRAIWGEVTGVADAAVEQGVHILAYHKVVSGRSGYEKDIRFRHRLVWLEHEILYGEESDGWWQDIAEKLRIEEAWRKSVRPSNHRHALILPRGQFATNPGLDPWTTAQRAETERAVARVKGEIDTFEESHRRQGRWRDKTGLLFDTGGPEHGRAPQSRRWKFTYHLPSGFHFDVRHERGREFTVTDADGQARRFKEYTNVDSHGYVRSGQ